MRDGGREKKKELNSRGDDPINRLYIEDSNLEPRISLPPTGTWRDNTVKRR
jgi:hypothetical protein